MKLLINQKEQSHCECPLANQLTSTVSRVSEPPNWEMIQFPLKMHYWEPSVVNNSPSASPFGSSGSSQWKCFPPSLGCEDAAVRGPCAFTSWGSSSIWDVWNHGVLELWGEMGPMSASPVLREENRGEAITNSDIIVTRRVCAGHSGDQIR